MNRFDGVVIDLWKTMVPLSDTSKRQAFTDTCAALGLDEDDLSGPWKESRRERETSALRPYLEGLGRRLGHEWTPAMLDAALRCRHAAHSVGFRDPLPGAERAVAGLRAAGLRVGLLSNCSTDVRGMLEESGIAAWFDVVALSCEIGIMKPDARVFRHVADALGVAPERCAYVGDGLDDELEGAHQAGMVPIHYVPDRAVATGRWTTIRTHDDLLESIRALDLTPTGGDQP